ncbi:YqcI/YcgG family-domain-containing protein [Suillus clintonianus]|uniref:YqcI/YcgG family-domain-containing protein n=1 Tax=Suillus clintonianus TaxID=1904413 RepID=UPI001B8761F9|nr:YqcI/YcgG family-domain-containing protein [Suillus clintonianus]KAG2140607.1 YqcI/YcgG family-domain-containing protein [Suillus clintonianus]
MLSKLLLLLYIFPFALRAPALPPSAPGGDLQAATVDYQRVIQTPAHQARRTRYAQGVTIVFQPRWIFDILFSTSAKRVGALAKVRALLAKYDSIPVSPELKNYGEHGSRESKQYFLLDENLPAPCPYDRLSDSKAILKSLFIVLWGRALW